jgi:hypothetical protein
MRPQAAVAAQRQQSNTRAWPPSGADYAFMAGRLMRKLYANLSVADGSLMFSDLST